ncbi:MAG: hypothetical protein VB023_02805 [Oscillibacter sp.]|nr:hypothetical protein [Oscillibacter sp.]
MDKSYMPFDYTRAVLRQYKKAPGTGKHRPKKKAASRRPSPFLVGVGTFLYELFWNNKY